MAETNKGNGGAVADKADKPEKVAHAFLKKNFMDEGKRQTIKRKDITRDRRLQVRSDTASQPGSEYPEVDEGRAEQIGEALADPARAKKVQPVKVMIVKDMPGHKDETMHVLFDGFHTHRGAEIKQIPELEAVVWEGTWSEALTAAATHANREHEANGRPLSSKDKVRSVELLGHAYKSSEIPKKDWPSNRQAADMCGCSRQLVNEIDPFDRSGTGNKREATAAKKRGERAAAKPAVKPPKHFDIVQKATGTKVAGYDADTPDEALARHKEMHKDFDMKSVVARENKEVAAKPGSEKAPIGFDWAGMDANLGYLVRGFDGMGDMFALKGTAEYKEAFTALDTFAKRFREFRQKNAKKPPTPAAAATPAKA